jgi:segregation and condensation protein B
VTAEESFVVPVLEAALLTSAQPLTLVQLRQLFDTDVSLADLRKNLSTLEQLWHGRGLALTQVASGWRFQTQSWVRPWLSRLEREVEPRYSRAVMETLAIIAYRQPVTRGDIEEIRGVTVSSPVIKTLEERGWIEQVGQRETPGRPALYGTTREFLDHLGLQSLQQLPAQDLWEAGYDTVTATTTS